MSPRLKGLLGAVALLSLIATWRLSAGAGADAEVVAPARRSAPATRAGRNEPPEAEVCVSADLPRRSAWDEGASAADPFAARTPPRPAPRPVGVADKPFVGPLPEVAPAPPPPPQLPYRFLGQWAERDGSQPKVFLLLGERLLMAAPGDLLEGGWRLERIQASELKFVRPSDQTVLTLAIDRN